MKKLLKAVTLIVFIESIILSCFIILFTYRPDNDDTDYGVYREATVDTVVKRNYNIKAEVEITRKSIRITEDIFFDTAKDKFSLYIPSANTAETKIKQVISDGVVSGITKQDTLLEVKLRNARESIRIDYEIFPGSAEGNLLHIGDAYYLTNFLITPMVYKNGKPVYTTKKKFGDPYIYEMNNYHVTFKTEDKLNVYAPGSKEEQVSDKYRITTFEALNVRDFPAVILGGADIYSEKYRDINLHFINSKEAGEYVKYTIKFAEENIGDYPYEDFYVVRAPISLKGMEFSNMVFISDKCFKDSRELKRVTYHEVLHQWFYGIIGTDQLNEPFFDEGLVNYLSITLSGGHVGPWKKKYLNKRLQDYTSRNEYYELAYNDSAAYFYTIHRKLGNNFYKLLNQVYNDWKFKIMYFDEFQKYINKY